MSVSESDVSKLLNVEAASADDSASAVRLEEDLSKGISCGNLEGSYIITQYRRKAAKRRRKPNHQKKPDPDIQRRLENLTLNLEDFAVEEDKSKTPSDNHSGM